MSNQHSAARGLFMVVGLALGSQACAVAQDKTFSERAKEYWENVVTGMESGAKSTKDEYHKLKAETAGATGPAREKMAAEMEVLSKKWASAREKLATSVDRHAHAIHEEMKTLEDKTEKATGPAREKMASEMESLRDRWHAAREKASTTYSSNMKAAGEEYTHLKGEASKATENARAKLAPRMERLKAEWSTSREKLSAYLEDDLKRTKEDLHKLEGATSDAAKAAKEKLTRKYHELRDRSEALVKDKSLDDPK